MAIIQLQTKENTGSVLCATVTAMISSGTIEKSSWNNTFPAGSTWSALLAKSRAESIYTPKSL